MSDHEGTGADVHVLHSTDDVSDEQMPVTFRKLDRPKCVTHKRVELDERSRRVYCKDCGEEVPAFDVLMEWARDFEWARHRRLDANRRATTARSNLADLERMERNAKSRLRNLRKKGALPDLDDLYEGRQLMWQGRS